jgi:hypothetical protein
VLLMQQHSIRVCPTQRCERTPWWRCWGGATIDLTLFKHGALTKRKWPVHPESTIAVSCCLRRGGVRQNSNVVLLLKGVAPTHHSLFA